MTIHQKNHIEAGAKEVRRIIDLFSDHPLNSPSHGEDISQLLMQLHVAFFTLFERESATMKPMEMPRNQKEDHHEHHGLITRMLCDISHRYGWSKNDLECMSDIEGLGETFKVHNEVFDAELFNGL